MAMPRRRSARLSGQSPLPQKRRPVRPSVPQLSTLLEREETPERGVTNSLDSIASPEPKVLSEPAILKTPSSTGPIRPDPAEMHPSLYQTANKINHGQGSNAPLVSALSTNNVNADRAEDNPLSSPTFDFRFNRPSTDLSAEAKKMMDEVREQAARIKNDLVAKQNEQDQSDGPGGKTERRIAKPKGKVGRFSDIHMESFKKMDSIADHPSSFRANPSRLPPSPQKSLKRSNSKAGLDEPEPSTKKTVSLVPAKKLRPVSNNGNVSQGVDKQEQSKPSTPTATKIKSNIPTLTSVTASTVTTPTKASLARSSSVKSVKTKGSLIPSLKRTPSTKTLTEPVKFNTAVTQSERKPSFTEKLMNVKSILRHPTIKFSDDPLKIAAGTHRAWPKDPKNASAVHLNKPLPDLPGDMPSTPSNRVEKHVGFSPSPIILGESKMISPHSPSALRKTQTDQVVSYPDLGAYKAGIMSSGNTGSFDTVPGDFSFKSDQTIKFAKATSDVRVTPTIRRVRPSNTGVVNTDSHTVSKTMPGIPHGLSNKKRKRESEEAAETSENKENQVEAPPQESPTKRPRITPAPSVPCTPTSQSKMTPSRRLLKSTPSRGRGILSMSRLNALARPKERK